MTWNLPPERLSGSLYKLSTVPAIAGRQRRRIRGLEPRPAPLPRPESAPTSRPTNVGTTLPQVAGLDVAILDELDKIHPATGDLIPPESEDYLTSNHLWSAVDRLITLHAARNEFIAFQVLLRGQASAGTIQPRLVFDGPPSRAIQVEIGRYYPVATKIGPVPDPIVPLDFPADGDSRHQAPEPAR